MQVNNSPIYRKGTTPVTRTALSTRTKVFSYAAHQSGKMKQIGMMSSLNPSQSRSVEARRGIGFGDRVAELVPGNMEPETLSVERTCLYLANIMQIFGYNYGSDGIVRALCHHRWPFDIREELVIPPWIVANDNSNDMTNLNPANESGETNAKAIVTFHEGCWMNTYSRTVSVDDTTIAESCDITVSDVYKPGTPYNYEAMVSGNYDGTPWSYRLKGTQTSGATPA